MNKLTTALLSSVALGALARVPVIADGAHHFHLMALHAGRVVNKTNLASQDGVNLTTTFSVSTYVPSSDFRKKVSLIDTFYRYVSSGSSCRNLPTKIKAPKKSMYGKVNTATNTYSFACSSVPPRFYGDAYKLTQKAGFGQTDTFVSVMTSKWTFDRQRYKGTLNLHVNVAIGTE